MKEILNEHFSGERALFQCNGLKISGTVFGEGESPLKHNAYIELTDCTFDAKYPVWYSEKVKLSGCTVRESGSEGIWYSSEINVSDTVIESEKCFRHSNGISMKNVEFTNGNETLWKCANVRMDNVKVIGDYFAMDCDGMEITGLQLEGNNAFDGIKNATLRRVNINGRDCFWNSENVVIYDSVIKGMYFGWNSRNITLVNCTVESLQGMCFMENLVLKNCKLPNTTLAFEYSNNISADIKGGIDSVKNPAGGLIMAESIGELIMENENVDVSRTKIICG
ncbi:MAG: DUF3737 family protein [Ruminococcus sp.]|uniref:DUF3737 family protein n=1 Tax=Ruminococcus flavefaciens TaxID=1265 RepID=UPI00156A25A0|nr:DUF3737 family protein [Ruminococcus flavefaciens]MBR0511292.1 DUF3737 family protein [Ruminococcus sp.]